MHYVLELWNSTFVAAFQDLSLAAADADEAMVTDPALLLDEEGTDAYRHSVDSTLHAFFPLFLFM